MPIVLYFDDYKIMEQKKNKQDFQDLPDNSLTNSYGQRYYLIYSGQDSHPGLCS